MDIILINDTLGYDLYFDEKHIAFSRKDVRNLKLKRKLNTNFLILNSSIFVVIGVLICINFYRIIPIILILFFLHNKLLPMWSYSINFTIGSEFYNLITNKKDVYLDFLGLIKK